MVIDMYGNYNSFSQPMYTQGTSIPRPTIPTQPMNTPLGLFGKVVDSADVVKVTDIPLDGSTSYFPLTDGSAILTKKLQLDGTSKITVYKPVVEEEKPTPKYVTFDDLEEIKTHIQDIENKLNGDEKHE